MKGVGAGRGYPEGEAGADGFEPARVRRVRASRRCCPSARSLSKLKTASAQELAEAALTMTSVEWQKVYLP
ncbi:hypothetical protein BIV24_15160 [Streptomyces colonosanans]|uniref:Uncharacterized protein n=1 Tax=Streptomyces colonosanans TaxID=1428652 RepID=A0A1S2PEK5_9ACTN|nr:hypothetical protein BIV24_15160 [Streptomyces colonosanans]